MQSQLGRDDDDLAIAATAIEHGFQIVTRNTKDFRATGVTIINPFEEK
jgi:predicted nucleic acid-binding protein